MSCSEYEELPDSGEEDVSEFESLSETSLKSEMLPPYKWKPLSFFLISSMSETLSLIHI